MTRHPFVTIAFGVLAAAASPRSAAAVCDPPATPFASTFVTYYEAFLPATSTDSRCTIEARFGTVVCHIRLRGQLYHPFENDTAHPPPWPTILYNHASDRTIGIGGPANCAANYFVPKGYVVFVPFRRGHGQSAGTGPDDTVPANTSTGTYLGDALVKYQNNRLAVNTSCNDNLTYPSNGEKDDCYRLELLNQEIADPIVGFTTYLSSLPQVDLDARAIMGTSYGGIHTVMMNAASLGQKAAVAFAAGARSWGSPLFQAQLIQSASQARQPTFYLQARWDVNTRPTIELSYAHATGCGSSSPGCPTAIPDPIHGRKFMASIFEFPKPPDVCDPTGCAPDYLSVHGAFSADARRWGPAVLNFLRRAGVK